MNVSYHQERGCFMPILLANRKQIYLLFFSHTTGSQYLLGDYNKEEHCFYPTFHGRFNFMSFLPEEYMLQAQQVMAKEES